VPAAAVLGPVTRRVLYLDAVKRTRTRFKEGSLMKVLFCHGLEGSPSGRKAAALRDAGHDVVAPQLPKEDFEAAVRIAREALSKSRPDVVVGSSRGGAIAIRVAATSPAPLVLLAPAWRRCGVEPVVRRDTRVLHGIKDEMVPLADSIELEARSDLPQENLVPVNDDHRLGSPLALASLLDAVARAAGYPSHDRAPRHTQIKVIRPYKWQGVWVFDDPSVGLDKEALVAGMPELIEAATSRAAVEEPEKGFVALFSKDPFPGAQLCLEWVREEGGGNVYRWPEVGREGWLCPALFRYFDRAPRRLYVEVRPAEGA
jgi:pimeloyl-ACP methyl ester carboxylesterase